MGHLLDTLAEGEAAQLMRARRGQLLAWNKIASRERVRLLQVVESVRIGFFSDIGCRLVALSDEVFRGIQEIVNCPAVPTPQGALPDYKCPPAVRPERGQRYLVAFDVSANFFPPE